MTIENNEVGDSFPTQEGTVQIPSSQLLFLLTKCLEPKLDGDDSTVYDERCRAILQTQIDITNCVVNTLLVEAEKVSVDLMSIDSGRTAYEFVLDCVDVTLEILKLHPSLKSYRFRIHQLLRMRVPKEIEEKEKGFECYRLLSLIQLRDWYTLGCEMRMGTITLSLIMQEFSFLNGSDKEYNNFILDKAVPYAISSSDWGVLVRAGFRGIRGGLQHPQIIGDIVSRAYPYSDSLHIEEQQ